MGIVTNVAIPNVKPHRIKHCNGDVYCQWSYNFSLSLVNWHSYTHHLYIFCGMIHLKYSFRSWKITIQPLYLSLLIYLFRHVAWAASPTSSGFIIIPWCSWFMPIVWYPNTLFDRPPLEMQLSPEYLFLDSYIDVSITN